MSASFPDDDVHRQLGPDGLPACDSRTEITRDQSLSQPRPGARSWLASAHSLADPEGLKMLPVPSFEADIRPLFRDKDRDSMLNHFDLWLFEDVRRNADRIYGALARDAMPCDTPWPQEHKDLLRRWIDGGTQP